MLIKKNQFNCVKLECYSLFSVQKYIFMVKLNLVEKTSYVKTSSKKKLESWFFYKKNTHP